MDGQDRRNGDVAVSVVAEIDTRAPFKSVKEAVELFGERVLVGEIYGNKLKEIQQVTANNGSSSTQSKIGALKTELEETKQSLDKAKEETNLMANCIDSLRQELEEAKKELQKLRAKEHHQKQPLIDHEINEDLKFMETPKRIEMIKIEDHDFEDEFCATKKNVKFASPTSLARVIVRKEDQFPIRSNSLKKTKRKPLGWLFAKKKDCQLNDQSPTVDAFC